VLLLLLLLLPPPTQFVVFEQYYDSLGSSPGGRANRPSGRGGSVSSSGCWGPSALASIGNGRQTLHIIGSRAAAGAAPAEQRVSLQGRGAGAGQAPRALKVGGGK
jgi:hypothetical protein